MTRVPMTREGREGLLPCPFCGGGDIREIGRTGDLLSWWDVRCRQCRGGLTANSREKAIAAWNTRTAASLQEDEVGRG